MFSWQACGVKSVFIEGMRVIKPGGAYVLTGMVHPDSKLDVTAETIIRKCLVIHGKNDYTTAAHCRNAYIHKTTIIVCSDIVICASVLSRFQPVINQSLIFVT